MTAYKAKGGTIQNDRPGGAQGEKLHILKHSKRFSNRAKCGRELDLSKGIDEENVFNHLRCKRCFG